MIVVISIEDTLALGPDLRSAAGYRGARPFYEALKASYQVVGLSRASPEVARWWLRKEHMSEWAQLLFYGEDHYLDNQEWKVQQVRDFLAEGWEVAFYIDSDFEALVNVRAIGVSTLSLDHALIRPGWRDPETTAPRAWSELASTVDTGGTDHGPG